MKLHACRFAALSALFWLGETCLAATSYSVVEMPTIPLDPDGFNYFTPGVLDSQGRVWVNVSTPLPGKDYDNFRTQRCTENGCEFSTPKNKNHMWRDGAAGNFVGAMYTLGGKEWQVRKLKGRPLEQLWTNQSGGVMSINSSGVAVGSRERDAVLFDTELHVLPSLAGGQGEAREVSDAGVVVGMSVNAAGFPCAVAWINLEIKVLHCPPANFYSYAMAISETGVVVGQSNFVASGVQHGVRFNSDGSLTDLGAVGATGRSSAMAVNAHGVAVGHGDDQDGQLTALLFDESGAVDLSTRISDADRQKYDLAYAEAINDSGQILVAAVKRFTEDTVVLRLDPTPAPGR